MVEKVYLDMEERDFEENFNQAILSNSLFNEKKIIFIRLKKNRLNKDLIASFKSISEANTENLIFIEIQSISKKIILKDILPIFKSNSHIVECSIVSDSNVIDFLAANLPQTVNNETNINNLVKLYEGNFSLLVNDLEILKVLDLTSMVSGPMGAMMLADQGAEVIKVEPVNGELVRHMAAQHNGVNAHFFHVIVGRNHWQ